MLKTIMRVINWSGDKKSRLYKGFIYSFFHSLFVGLPIVGLTYFLNHLWLDANGLSPIDPSVVYAAILVMIVAVAGRYLFSYLRAINQDSIAYEVTAAERIDIGHVLKRVPLGFFEKNNVGELTAAITNDLSYLEMHAMKMIDNVVNGYLMVFIFIIALSFYSLTVGLIALSGVLLSGLALTWLGKKSRNNSPVHAASQETMVSAVIEYIRGIALVKAFKQQGVSAGRLKSAFAESRRINIKIEQDYVFCNCLHLFSLKLATVALVFYSAYSAVQGTMPLSTTLMILIFSFILFSHIEVISNSAHVLNMIDATMDKVAAIKNAEFIDLNGVDKPLSDYQIHFDHVSFGYDEQPVINDVSFFIPAGTTTAIVGPSGSGKTTLCNLMARFYDVNSGVITIGNTDIATLTCDSLLTNISMVFQKVYLFHDTVFNNIHFGNPTATMAEVVAAAQKACCHDFIMALPQGYHTLIGEGGSSLSGGEKQRISMARAMLKNAPIIILDEATASVDPENEHLIQQAISELTRNKTIIIIAHRLATIEKADQILVVADGSIVQRGNHQQLSQEAGLYRRFIKIRETAESWALGQGGTI
ncbi:ABC transporter ATP-binding protein [Acetobacterium bakii]|uniref:Multidrug ABC transporter ATP-binding protein n=1 Tax=Acetobacterium bakii TaxID=52689 RepID=A0A0L6U135_9FIRM|nr:ABC transporter ATP-binding protein [Acetobacterium bakii]KNZ42219.1 multidrug ABC transporter ATP-binding protein [Acetobacterium bakii]